MISIPGKIPVHIHPLFWFLATFIGWVYTQTPAGTGVAVLVIMLSLLIHEFGHALTAFFLGQRPSVHLVAIGGLTTRHGGRHDHGQNGTAASKETRQEEVSAT